MAQLRLVRSMRPLSVIWLVLCSLPLLALAAAPLFPHGTDPRGFGPRFAVSIYACVGSLVLGMIGVALIIFARRFELRRAFIIATTLAAAAPFLYLLALIALRRV